MPAATSRLPDERVSHFWDGQGALKTAYQRVMKMSEPAWDVYYVYGRNAEWSGDPPVPAYYMHQLGSLPPERMLNGDGLAVEVNRLLQQTN